MSKLNQAQNLQGKRDQKKKWESTIPVKVESRKRILQCGESGFHWLAPLNVIPIRFKLPYAIAFETFILFMMHPYDSMPP